MKDIQRSLKLHRTPGGYHHFGVVCASSTAHRCCCCKKLLKSVCFKSKSITAQQVLRPVVATRMKGHNNKRVFQLGMAPRRTFKTKITTQQYPASFENSRPAHRNVAEVNPARKHACGTKVSLGTTRLYAASTRCLTQPTRALAFRPSGLAMSLHIPCALIAITADHDVIYVRPRRRAHMPGGASADRQNRIVSLETLRRQCGKTKSSLIIFIRRRVSCLPPPKPYANLPS